MDGATIGIIGAVVGGLIGILGGAAGLWNGLRQARSDAERHYMLVWSAGCWIGIVVFLVVLVLLPHPYRWLAFIPYILALFWGIRKGNLDLSSIRAAEERKSA